MERKLKRYLPADPPVSLHSSSGWAADASTWSTPVIPLHLTAKLATTLLPLGLQWNEATPGLQVNWAAPLTCLYGKQPCLALASALSPGSRQIK